MSKYKKSVIPFICCEWFASAKVLKPHYLFMSFWKSMISGGGDWTKMLELIKANPFSKKQPTVIFLLYRVFI
ncbi:MAG: hypothetical protein EA409_00680 [Saprospirales bacterium]|nr:MAG: hypothetical protein EA409_00680 [Saprospirales bacterium]